MLLRTTICIIGTLLVLVALGGAVYNEIQFAETYEAEFGWRGDGWHGTMISSLYYMAEDQYHYYQWGYGLLLVIGLSVFGIGYALRKAEGY
jgi:hypothetical protein